jgi:prephenate dehydratase
MKIAIQGELGSFSHEAAIQMVPQAIIIPCRRSAEVFNHVEKGTVAAAVIPIENTLAGSVLEHYDLLLSHDVFIQKEFHLRIVHNLIVANKVKLNEIKKIFSHPIALEQCRKFLGKYPRIQAIPFYDTAGSVSHVIDLELRDAAAIASELAAKEHHGQILKKSIEDNKHNFTRFFLIRKNQRVLRGANKTSIAFSIKNSPGALFKSLSIFALRNIDLSKIESRPVRGKPWQYIFFIDVLRGNDRLLQDALKQLAKNAEFVKVLGIYPAA